MNTSSSQPLKVAILNNEIMPYRIPLFNALADRGNLAIHVLYSGSRAPERQWSISRQHMHYDYTVLPSQSVRLKKPSYQEPRILWLTPTLLHALGQIKPDIVIGYEFSLQAIAAEAYSRFARVPYLTWTEMTARTDQGLTLEQRMTRRYLMPRTHAFIGTSKAACENLTDKGIDPTRVILAPQPLDLHFFAEQTALWRTKVEPHPPRILYVGFLSQRKGIIHLINSFREVLEHIPEAVLRLVGHGDEYDALITTVHENGMQDSVEFIGFVEPTMLPRLYAEADIFVLPTLEDTFGVVATEALASRLPLVCSCYAGFASHLSDGIDSYIVDPLDTGTMAQRIVTLLKDPDLRAAFNEASHQVLAACAPEQVAIDFEHACDIAQRLFRNLPLG